MQIRFIVSCFVFMLSVIHLVRVLVVSFTGIAFDILMIQFLKKRSNSVGPGQAKLVKWKSSNEELSITVPVMATIATLVCDLISIATIASVGLIISQGFSRKVFYFECYLLMTLQMPVILGLTLRVAKKKQAPKVPKTLMFHDDGCENDEETKNETNNIASEDQIQQELDDERSPSKASTVRIEMVNVAACHPSINESDEISIISENVSLENNMNSNVFLEPPPHNYHI